MDLSSAATKPMRGGPANSEAKTRGEQSSEGQKAERGTTGRSRIKSLYRERTFQMHESLSFASFI